MRGHFAAAAAAAPIGGLENGPEAAESCQEGQTRQMEGWMDSRPRVLPCRFGIRHFLFGCDTAWDCLLSKQACRQ